MAYLTNLDYPLVAYLTNSFVVCSVEATTALEEHTCFYNVHHKPATGYIIKKLMMDSVSIHRVVHNVSGQTQLESVLSMKMS